MNNRGSRIAPATIVVVLLICGCSADGTTTVAVQGGPVFAVEVADDAAARAQGLSGRDGLDADTGMLFTYPQAGQHAYWMHQMLMPIDVAWIRDATIIGTVTLQPCAATGPCEQHPSPGPVDMVLEVAAGALRGVSDGTGVTID